MQGIIPPLTSRGREILQKNYNFPAGSIRPVFRSYIFLSLTEAL
jgi:hypothetical protein